MEPRRVVGARAPARAVAMLFLANGLTLSLLPRLPQVKDAVGADAGMFGLALLGTGIGGLVGSMATPALLARIGPRRAATVPALLLAATTVLVGVAGSVPVLFVVLAVMGLLDGVADIGQNHLMFEVQRTASRSLTSRMHAVWSTGALLGTGIGTGAAAAGLSVAVQLVAVAVLAAALVAMAAPTLRQVSPAPPRPAPVPPGPSRRRPMSVHRWVVVAMAAVAAAAVEGVANEWSALTLRDGLGAGPALAGAGPTVFAGAMLVGRLTGDRAIDRWGRAVTARAGAGAVVGGSGVGLGVATWSGQGIWLVVGLAVAGIGAATLFPSMLAAGDRLEASGTGVAVASSAARIGFLVVPVVVGGVADALGFTVAFSLLPVAGVVVTVALPMALASPAAPVPASSLPPRHW